VAFQASARRELSFNVFGRLIAVVGSERGWEAFHLGPEGKRRRADVAIPRCIAEVELAACLADLFHEAATPRNSEVVRLP
jgi:hypothetical protein